VLTIDLSYWRLSLQMPPLINSHPLLWALLSVPAALWLWRYGANAMSYGEFIHASGDLSAQLLIATLAVTPLRLFFPRAAWTQWLAARRRDVGVATFGYAALHTIIYLVRKADAALILKEGIELSLLAGWIALFIFAALALTSNDASVRLLKRAWKRLHALVHIGAILTFAHWVLTAFDPVIGYIHAGVLAAIEAARFIQRARRRAIRASHSS
jgi:sulfoxide reductase heme-binding subunit YedZ